MEVIAEEEEGWRLNNKEGVFPSTLIESTPVPAEPPPEPGQNLTLHAHTHTHCTMHGWFSVSFVVPKSIFS